MDKEQIKKLIPHREPMLLVDNADLIDGVCVAQYTVKENDFFTQGHFPGNPIVPGVILCEMMAQACAPLIGDSLLDGKLALYAGLEGVRFKRIVRPGDTVVTHSNLVGRKGPVVMMDAEATVDGVLCCKGRLSFIITDQPLP